VLQEQVLHRLGQGRRDGDPLARVLAQGGLVHVHRQPGGHRFGPRLAQDGLPAEAQPEVVPRHRQGAALPGLPETGHRHGVGGADVQGEHVHVVAVGDQLGRGADAFERGARPAGGPPVQVRLARPGPGQALLDEPPGQLTHRPLRVAFGHQVGAALQVRRRPGGELGVAGQEHQRGLAAEAAGDGLDRRPGQIALARAPAEDDDGVRGLRLELTEQGLRIARRAVEGQRLEHPGGQTLQRPGDRAGLGRAGGDDGQAGHRPGAGQQDALGRRRVLRAPGALQRLGEGAGQGLRRRRRPVRAGRRRPPDGDQAALAADVVEEIDLGVDRADVRRQEGAAGRAGRRRRSACGGTGAGRCDGAGGGVRRGRRNRRL
jgi:hypothetical protein